MPLRIDSCSAAIPRGSLRRDVILSEASQRFMLRGEVEEPVLSAVEGTCWLLCGNHAGAIPGHPSLKEHVISTEAADSLIVRCAVERPLYFDRAGKE
jgi:hypothetical protein